MEMEESFGELVCFVEGDWGLKSRVLMCQLRGGTIRGSGGGMSMQGFFFLYATCLCGTRVKKVNPNTVLED